LAAATGYDAQRAQGGDDAASGWAGLLNRPIDFWAFGGRRYAAILDAP